MGDHYDEQFERDIQEAVKELRTQNKPDNIQRIFTEADLSHYLKSVDDAKKNKLKSDYILGDLTEEDLLKGLMTDKDNIVTSLSPSELYDDDDSDPWNPLDTGPPLKETKGKAKGARYCYLADIAKTSFDHSSIDDPVYDLLLAIGEHLSIIVASLDGDNVANAQYYCSDLLNLIHETTPISELIGVRSHALSTGKYSVDGYKEPINVDLLLDAAARHFLELIFVGDTDEESGFSHKAHISANMVMIYTQLEERLS